MVCTNKHGGPRRNHQAVLGSYHKLLVNYINDPPREDNEITFYGNDGLITAVNCESYETDTEILPVSGLNELNCGIIESLVDDQVMQWCILLLENQSF